MTAHPGVDDAGIGSGAVRAAREAPCPAGTVLRG